MIENCKEGNGSQGVLGVDLDAWLFLRLLGLRVDEGLVELYNSDLGLSMPKLRM